MYGLKRLIREIHRRSLSRVAGIYLLTSWLMFVSYSRPKNIANAKEGQCGTL